MYIGCDNVASLDSAMVLAINLLLCSDNKIGKHIYLIDVGYLVMSFERRSLIWSEPSKYTSTIKQLFRTTPIYYLIQSAMSFAGPFKNPWLFTIFTSHIHTYTYILIVSWSEPLDQLLPFWWLGSGPSWWLESTPRWDCPLFTMISICLSKR